MDTDGEKQGYYCDISFDSGEEYTGGDNLHEGNTSKVRESEENNEDSAVPCDTAFNVRVVEEKLNSVCLDWNSLDDMDVYKVEKYHRRRGWEQVAWWALLK